MAKVKTILYAEDDPVVLTAYRMRLQRAGYHVIAACDGLDAIKKLSTFVPDLILLDLMMPRFNGDEVLQFIHTNPGLAKIPVIILSTNSVRDIANESLLEYASKRLIKSKCTTAMLLDAVEEIFGDSAAERADRPAYQREEHFSETLQPVAA